MEESGQKASENAPTSKDVPASSDVLPATDVPISVDALDSKDVPKSDDAPASESTLISKGVVDTSPESAMGNKASTSTTDDATSTPVSSQEGSGKADAHISAQSPAKQTSDQLSDPVPGDKGEEGEEGSSKPPVVKSSELPVGSRKKSSHESKEHESSGGKTSSTTTSGSGGGPSGDGAMGAGGSDVMAKMMAMMAKGSATPKAPGTAQGSMMDMMSQGGGMPDMMAMMAKGGGMVDMKAMMSKGGRMGMAKLFDCIIDVSLARPDSDPEDDDADSITVEIPCQYCSRFFTSQMTLKTHILVAHEHEDSSVLNLKKLVIDKGKRGVKDHHGSRRKQSKDRESLAATETVSATRESQQHEEAGSVNPVTSSQEDLSAADTSRRTKRGRNQRRKSQAAEGGEVSAVGEGSVQTSQDQTLTTPGTAPSSSSNTTSPPESRKRSARLRSLRSSSGDGSSQITTKKSKSDDEKNAGDSQSAQEATRSGTSTKSSSGAARSGKEAPNVDDSKPPRTTTKETSSLKEIKTDSKRLSPIRHAPNTRGKRLSRKDKDMAKSDTDISAKAGSDEGSNVVRDRSRKSRQSSSVPTASVPASGSSSAQGSGAGSASTRSLRSRKSR